MTLSEHVAEIVRKPHSYARQSVRVFKLNVSWWHLISVAGHRSCGGYVATWMRRDRKCPANSAHPQKTKEDLDLAQMLTNLFIYMDPIMSRFLELSGIPYPLNLINDIYTRTHTQSGQLMLIWYHVTTTNLVFKKWGNTENTTSSQPPKEWVLTSLSYVLVITEHFSIFWKKIATARSS